MTTQLEDRLATDLQALPVGATASHDFIEGVLGQATRRRRAEGLAQIAAMAVLALVLGVGVWVNLPADVPITTAAAPATAEAETIAESPYALTPGQQGMASVVDAVSAVWGSLVLRLALLAVLLGAVTFFVGRFRRSTGRPQWRWQGLRAVLLTLVVLIAAFVWTFDVFYLPSASMEPTFGTGSRVLVNAHDTDVEIGDLVIARIEAPGRPPVIPHSVKRVVGLSGDEVSAVAGELLINGHRLENWIGHSDGKLRDFGPVIVPDGDVFFIGDNVTGSLDSRDLGTWPVEVIEGTILWSTTSVIPASGATS